MIYKNKLGRACFAHDAACSYSKDLAKRTNLNKILKDKAYEITLNPKYNGYRRGLASMVYKFFDEKNRANANKVLAQKLHKTSNQKKKESLCHV